MTRETCALYFVKAGEIVTYFECGFHEEENQDGFRRATGGELRTCLDTRKLGDVEFPAFTTVLLDSLRAVQGSRP